MVSLLYSVAECVVHVVKTCSVLVFELPMLCIQSFVLFRRIIFCLFTQLISSIKKSKLTLVKNATINLISIIKFPLRLYTQSDSVRAIAMKVQTGSQRFLLSCSAMLIGI